MDLFEMVNGHVFPSPHALLIEPFKTIWEEDTSDGRVESIKIFTYIELMCSPKKSNPYHGYPDDLRPAKVKKEVWKDENYRLTTLTMVGVTKYKELLEIASPTYELYLSGLEAAESLKQYLKEVNLKERTTSGAMVIKPKDVIASLNEIPVTIEKMANMRNKVLSELSQDAKTRKQRQIGFFER